MLETLASQGIRLTFFLFPSEDTESMNNLMDLFILQVIAWIMLLSTTAPIYSRTRRWKPN